MSDVKSDSIPETENRFRSAGIGELKPVPLHLYPNRGGLVKHIGEHPDFRQNYKSYKIIPKFDGVQKT